MVTIYGTVCIVLLMVVSFFGGILTANWYNEKARREEQYLLEKQYLRLKAGADFYDPAGPYVSRCRAVRPTEPCDEGRQTNGFSFSQMQNAFEEKLNNTGSATVLLKNSTKNNIKKEK